MSIASLESALARADIAREQQDEVLAKQSEALAKCLDNHRETKAELLSLHGDVRAVRDQQEVERRACRERVKVLNQHIRQLGGNPADIGEDGLMDGGELREREVKVRAAVVKARLLTATALIIAGFCILAVLIVAVFVVRDKTTTETSASEQIAELTQQIDVLQADLETARAQLEANTDAIQAENECVQSFNTDTAFALAEYLATLGDLVVTISTVIPGPEREAAVTANITLLAQRIAEYRHVVAQRVAWDEANRPTECPV